MFKSLVKCCAIKYFLTVTVLNIFNRMGKTIKNLITGIPGLFHQNKISKKNPNNYSTVRTVPKSNWNMAETEYTIKTYKAWQLTPVLVQEC